MGKEKNKKLYILLALEALIIFSIHVSNVNSLYAFFLSEDELGYWGNAAFFLGKDWGNTMSHCAYYSYGYSLFLMLIMSLPISSLMMYRLAVVANGLFMVGSFFISFYLIVQLLPKRNRFFVSIVCTAISLYGAYVSWSSIAWSECYLVLFVWLVLLQGYLICKKVNWVRGIVFVIELVYMYMIHQRTIPFLISGVLLLIILAAYKKVSLKQLIFMLTIVIGMVYISLLLKKYLQLSAYGTVIIKNDYSSIVTGMNFSNLFIPVIKEIAGQLYYLWSASFGIILLGVGMSVVICIKKWEKKDSISFFYGFVLLSFLGMLIVSSIFMRISVQRVDQLIYGRYNEIIVGFFIIIGFLYLLDFVKWEKSWEVFLISSVIFIGLAFTLVNKIRTENISLDSSYQGINAVGTYCFYSLRGFNMMELCVVILIVETMVFILLKKLTLRKWLLAIDLIVMVIFWEVSGQMVIKQQICSFQTGNQDLSIKNDLWDYIKAQKNSVVLLTNTVCLVRGSIQFYLQDIPLYCVQDISGLNEMPDIVIIDNDGSTIAEKDLEKYHFVCLMGKRSVYSRNEIELSDLQGEINKNLFRYKQIGIDESGYAMFGPYICLAPGSYEVVFQMSEKLSGQGDLGILDVTCDGGGSVICSEEWNGSSQFVTMQFQLEEMGNNIEFRYYKYGGNDAFPVRVILNEVKN